jgi:beta-glucosidase-like glycosyl hydrolase
MPIIHTLYKFYFSLIIISLFSFINIDKDDRSNKNKSLQAQEAWVEKQFQNLSEEEGIAQLFMVAAYSNKQESHYQAIEELIQRYNIGGLIFFQGNPISQVNLTNRYQKAAKTPLLLGIDAEWGLGMRLTNTISYPKQMTLGAIEEDKLIYNMGAEIARQLKLLGVHINFAPVVDINTNPDNPGIGRRSFGDVKEIVAIKALAYIKGLQDQGILAVAKHFPGIGDASKDSHLTLPIILHDSTRLDKVELFPFKEAIAAGVGGVMVSHLFIPAYDTTLNRASSLSPQIVTGLLKEQLGFKGLVFTDALNMKAVSKYYQPSEVDLLALQAGNDVLLFPEDVPKAIELIKQAINEGKLDKASVTEKVKKILRVKYQMKLHQWKPINTHNLHKQLNRPQAQLLKQQLFEQAITVVANNDHLIPIRKLDKHQFACLSIIKQPNAQKDTKQGHAPTTDPATLFGQQLSKYGPMSYYSLNRDTYNLETLEELGKKLKRHKTVIVDIHHLSGNRANKFGLKEELLDFLKNLQETNIQVILVVFGNVYSLELFQDFNHLIAAYEDDPVAEQVVPQIIFGALPAMGKLPVSTGS